MGEDLNVVVMAYLKTQKPQVRTADNPTENGYVYLLNASLDYYRYTKLLG
jgi:hypothetical protein